MLTLDVAAMHRSRANWGPAPLTFDPARHFASGTSADERVIVVSQVLRILALLVHKGKY
jgi:hypothetical protein